MSKPPSTVQTTSNSTQSVPQYVSDAQQALLGYGSNQLAPFLSSNPNYSVAGTNTDQQTGYDLTRQLAQGAFTNSPSMPSWYGSNAASPSAPAANTYAPTMAGQGNFYNPTTAGAAQTYAAVNAGQAQGYNADNANAARLSGGDYAEFMNPFAQGVIDPAVSNLRRQSDINAAQIGAQGAASGSFGGSRDALRQGQNTRALGEQTSQMVSQLMSAGYDKATQQAMANTQMQQQTGLANQSAQNAARQFGATATNNMNQFNAGQINQASQFGASATNAQNLANAGIMNAGGQFNSGVANSMTLANANALNQAGQTNAASQNARDQFLASLGLQGRAQDLTASQMQNSMMNDEQTRRYQAIQALITMGNSQQTQLQNILNAPNSALAKLQGLTPGTVPVNTASTGTAPNTQKSLFEQLLGAGISLGGAALLPCDARLKRDIQPYGFSEAGRPLFSYRYKWDNDDAPRTIGPMAQIEEAHDPDSVVEVLGIKLVKVH